MPLVRVGGGGLCKCLGGSVPLGLGLTLYQTMFSCIVKHYKLTRQVSFPSFPINDTLF